MSNTTTEYDYQIITLTQDFYKDYPQHKYREIARKNNRPYNCLLIESMYGYFICIPYRTHISHKNAFRFKHSIRSILNKSGLDYSKVLLISKGTYIGTSTAVVDQDEYKETRDNIDYIVNDIVKYIDEYVGYLCNKPNKITANKFYKNYKYSTLQYFHNELGIAK